MQLHPYKLHAVNMVKLKGKLSSKFISNKFIVCSYCLSNATNVDVIGLYNSSVKVLEE